MSLLKILIVEDEKLAREKILRLLQWENYGFQIVEAARNGAEGYDAFCKWHPDIIITDIQMPIMNGLLMLAKIKATNPAVRTVILSCHENFHYAKEAIRLGVDGYVVKDFVSPDEVLSVLVGIQKKFALQTGVSEPVGRIQVAEDKGLQQARNLVDALRGKRSALQALHAFHQTGQMFWLLKIVLDEHAQLTDLSNADHSAHPHALRIRMIQEFERNFQATVAYPCPGEYLVLLGMAGARTITEEAASAIGTAHGVISESCACSLTSGVSAGFLTFSALKTAYKQAEEAVRYRIFLGKGRVIHTHTIQQMVFLKPTQIEVKIDALRTAVTTNDIERVFAGIKALYAPNFSGMLHYHYVKYVNAQLITILLQYCQQTNRPLRDIFGCNYVPFEQLDALETVHDISAWFEQAFRKLAQISSERIDQLTTNKKIRKALATIHEHYAEDLTLDGIAATTGAHKVYFSRLFKQELGITYYDYLTRYRIEKAKQLMVEPSYKIYEIGRMVGFRTYDQFCNAFKRITGSIPSEFITAN
ncbi:hypothetical protein CSA56_15025 [candidate division KSB3 bacterium]|uniref:DNA-binding response regulator n=1 Tax=candidate division KSB3 bacterium TaxID=2044937 RepID=A0A2G6KA46_9BACT|nr:MAG: hypothetical protein CSA56_15025 [candidate division KSB3 bacterium]